MITRAEVEGGNNQKFFRESSTGKCDDVTFEKMEWI